MAETEKTVFKFDLDNADFLKKALESKNAILAVGDTENIGALIETLGEATIAIGILGAAAFAVKAAFDLTLEAESIRRTSEQFDLLAQSAGLAGEELKHGLLEAAGGLASENEILQAANRAMISLGDSAKRLPEIMELARKATLVFGGSLTQNFQSLAQAMATGQTRMLKQYGITLDNAKAEREYAASLGVTVGELSEAGKRQAILNAALEAGKSRFKDIKGDADSATTNWEQMKVALKELSEAFTLAFDNTIGPTVRRIIKTFKGMAVDLKNVALANFGDDAQKAEQKLSGLNTSLENTNKQIAYFKNIIDKDSRPAAVEQARASMEKAEKKAQDLREQIEKLKATVEKSPEKKEAEKPGGAGNKDPKVDQEKHKQQVAKFNAEMLALRQKGNADDLAAETDFDDAMEELHEKRLLAEEALEAKIAELRASDKYSPQQKIELEKQLRENAEGEFEQIEKNKLQVYQQTASNMQKLDQTTTKGFVNGWKGAAMGAQAALKDWSSRGVQAANTVSGSLVAGFKAMGDGSKDAADAMKDAFLKSVGDQAVAEGSKMLLAGLWPPNPIELGAGAALVALGGKLGSMASAPSASGGSSSASGALTSDTTQGVGASAASANALTQDQTQQQKKTVTINYHGDFLSTDQTRQQFTEMVRRELDATDFNINSVGR